MTCIWCNRGDPHHHGLIQDEVAKLRAEIQELKISAGETANLWLKEERLHEATKLQVERLRTALEECACSQHLHEAKDARTGCHGPCPVCTAMAALGMKVPKQWQTEADEREGLLLIEALKLKLGWIEKPT